MIQLLNYLDVDRKPNMELSILIPIVVVVAILVGVILSVIVTSKRQDARKRANPSRHRGEFQSQKGRVYNVGSTNHNDSPTSPG